MADSVPVGKGSFKELWAAIRAFYHNHPKLRVGVKASAWYLAVNFGLLAYSDRVTTKRYQSLTEFTNTMGNFEFYRPPPPTPCLPTWRVLLEQLKVNYFSDVPYTIAVRGTRVMSDAERKIQGDQEQFRNRIDRRTLTSFSYLCGCLI